jgi:FkbM family methyltransferase
MFSSIEELHSGLQLRYGSFQDELPEQKMAFRYLTGNEKVLELGGNIGRNSLVIASILNKYSKGNDKNLVVMETCNDSFNKLNENRDINNLNFNIENSALSKKKLIQKEWNAIPSDIILDGYFPVNIIDYKTLESKYQIKFDTLVLDCEGAFYYILQDMPEILTNINLIIMENDYTDINHKNFVNTILRTNNFYRDYVEAGGWGCCYNCFFEVWKRRV